MADKVITSYPYVDELFDADVFLIDGEEGTRTITADALADYAYDKALDGYDIIKNDKEIADSATSNIKFNVDANSGKSKSGSFIHVDDMADSALFKDFVINFDSRQYCNGYDRPWVAGGGDNIFPGCVPGTYRSRNISVTVTKDDYIYIEGTSSSVAASVSIPLKRSFKIPERWGAFLHLLNNTNRTGITVILRKKSDPDNTSISVQLTIPGMAQQIPNDKHDVAFDQLVISVAKNTNPICTLRPTITENYSMKLWAPYTNICPISGASKVTAFVVKRNLCLFTKSITFGSNDTSNVDLQTDYAPFPSGSYTFSWTQNADVEADVNRPEIIRKSDNLVIPCDEKSLTAGRKLWTVTLSSDDEYKFRWATANLSKSCTVSDFMLEYGDHVSEYEDYDGTAIDFDFAPQSGVQYGGFVNLATGDLVVEKSIVDLGELKNWTYYRPYTGDFDSVNKYGVFVSSAIASDVLSGIGCSSAIFSSHYTTATSIGDHNKTIAVRLTDGTVCITDAEYDESTINEFVASLNGMKLVYPLKDSIEFHKKIPDVRTMSGAYNIWSDFYNVNISYPIDIKTYIDSHVAEAVASLPTTTLSGEMIRFTNPNDAWPLKSAKVNIEFVQSGSGKPSSTNIRSIYGRSVVNVTVCGENISPISIRNPWTNMNTTVSNGSGAIYRDESGKEAGYRLSARSSDVHFGSYNGAGSAANLIGYTRVKPGMIYSVTLTEEYTSSTDTSRILTDNGYQFLGADGKVISNNGSSHTSFSDKATISVPSDAYYIGFCVGSKLASSGVSRVFRIQVAYGGVHYGDHVYNGTSYSIALKRTVYGGTLDVKTGELVVTRGVITSYSGQTITGRWWSDRDTYRAGATPSRGAKVVYELDTPLTYYLDPVRVRSLAGENNIWADAPSTLDVTYYSKRINTVRDSIVSISDAVSSVPFKDVTAHIEPVQDLHGQDAPYPAGGGNSVIDFESIFSEGWTNENGGITATYSKGYITVTGTNNTSGWINIVAFTAQWYNNPLVLPAGTYTVADHIILSCSIDGGAYRNERGTITANTSIEIRGFYIAVNTGQTVNWKVPMVVAKGSTVPTTFIPYSNICPITGWTGAKVTRTGKNIINPSELVYYANVNNVLYGTQLPPDTDFVFSTDSINTGLYAQYSDDDEMPSIFGTGWTDITYEYNTTSLKFNSGSHKWYRLMIFEINGVSRDGLYQLELGTTATAYEPYSGQTYDITFPSEAGTVYGGTLDVTKGELVVDKAIITMDGSQQIAESQSKRFYTTIPSAFTVGVSNQTTYKGVISDKFRSFSWGSLAGASIGCAPVYGHGISFKHPDMNTVDDWKTYFTSNPTVFSYELATPITYQLTPQEITSLLGENNLWSDSGDTTVKYRIAANETN